MCLVENQGLPPWHTPKGTPTELSVYNSLTRSKVPFTITRKDGHIGWYICGPTVYDAAHMGHARSYITFDVLRRIFENYFGWPVIYVMNITDIDDKIILRARQNHLFEKFVKDNGITEKTTQIDDRFKSKMTATITEAFVAYVNRQLGTDLKCQSPSDIPLVFKNATNHALSDSKYALSLENISNVYQKGVLPMLNSLSGEYAQADCCKETDIDGATLYSYLENCFDCIAPYLDLLHGDQITDQRIFKQLAEKWEASFMEDMERLNVIPPTTLTRVTGYLPQIVAYIEKIIENGYAYVANGSVYFDTQAFIKNNHTYAKLEPSSAGNVNLINEGEGSLFLREDTATPSSASAALPFQKKHSSDFALWKKSKKGEPTWQSPWSEGRPGWHIECSAMAGDVLGKQLDIHSGGIDLRFPHHDNEIAQSEAYYDCHQWVNYFLHAGHLHIEGQKMSKSLKNFVTIEEALQKYTARQIRLMFLLHSWQDTLDYKITTMDEAVQAEGWLLSFFATLLAVGVSKKSHDMKASFSYAAFKEHAIGLRQYEGTTNGLLDCYLATIESVHKAMCDSFDTPTALQSIFELCKYTKSYINVTAIEHTNAHNLLGAIGSYVTWWLSATGVIVPTNKDGIEGSASSSMLIGFPEQSLRDSICRPFLTVVGQFRDDMRTLARSGLALDEAGMRDVLKAVLARCDLVRDEDMLSVGVEMEDRENLSSLLKVGDAKVLLEKLAVKSRALKEKNDRKQALLDKQNEREREKREKAKISPETMFLGMTESFSEFNIHGFPTKDEKGVELSKNRIKKLTLEFEAQKKLYKGQNDQ